MKNFLLNLIKKMEQNGNYIPFDLHEPIPPIRKK
jgi:hypothetical protein